jgi:hypothetical protein
VIAEHEGRIANLEEQMAAEREGDQPIAGLMKVSGIGPVVSLAFAAFIHRGWERVREGLAGEYLAGPCSPGRHIGEDGEIGRDHETRKYVSAGIIGTSIVDADKIEEGRSLERAVCINDGYKRDREGTDAHSDSPEAGGDIMDVVTGCD